MTVYIRSSPNSSDCCDAPTVRKLRAGTPPSDAAVLVSGLSDVPLSTWDGLTADDIVRVIMTCWEAGCELPPRGSDAFGAAVSGDADYLRGVR